jgi:hypothetical protein
MEPWATHPVIYEINTWVWLGELSRKHKRPVSLATVPAQEWETIASFGFDAVWFMGVWERSPAGIAVSMKNDGLLADFRRALPDFVPQDNVGSPYCVRRYVVDQHLGGQEGLAVARKKLAEQGMRLMLDFVPNHVAPDHPWVTEHPDYFIQGSDDDLRREPASFMDAGGGRVLACGRDPYFPAWQDVLQLNAFHPGLRQAAVETVNSIADQCDGVRCDMAMLMMNDVFARTWGGRAGAPPGQDYWTALIPAVRSRHAGFLFMAEAYWDLEWALQQQGFDYCYDKRLYDRLEHDKAESVRLHLCAEREYQRRLVRFIENHDEPRAAATFGPGQARAAAVTSSTQQGARLLHEGQFEGRKVRLPVFLGRRPEERLDPELTAFYAKLLKAIRAPLFRQGEWRLCERSGWADNATFENLVAWCWTLGQARALVVVNLSAERSQARVRLPWNDLSGRSRTLKDLLTGARYERDGAELEVAGLYVDLEAWGFHVLEF